MPVDIDVEELRSEVRAKYSAVVDDPHDEFHFHTGRFLADHLGYDAAAVDPLPDVAIESFAGVANPIALRPLRPGERVVDLGSGAGLDSFVAASAVGDEGDVVGVDMTTPEPTEILEAPGLACISLTPLIKRTISELEHGAVLEVRTDDPTARSGVPSWCRLTRNPLLHVVEHGPTTTTFHIRSNRHEETNQS